MFPARGASQSPLTSLRHAPPTLWDYYPAGSLHPQLFCQDSVLCKTDHTIRRILVKFSWHVLDFPVHSNIAEPGIRQNAKALGAFCGDSRSTINLNKVFLDLVNLEVNSSSKSLWQPLPDRRSCCVCRLQYLGQNTFNKRAIRSMSCVR